MKKTKNKRDALLRFKGVVKNEKVKKIVDKILVLEKELKWFYNNLSFNMLQSFTI